VFVSLVIGMGPLHLLARDSNPVPIRAESQIAYRQCRPDKNLLKLVSNQRVFAHGTIFRTGDKEAILTTESVTANYWFTSHTYTRDDCRIVLLAVIYCDRLIVRPGCKDAAVIIDSGCDEFLSVRRVRKKGCAGRI
jgi:hypothetical protein